MKFTSEELAKLLGIKIGDRIRLSNGEVGEITEDYKLNFRFGRVGLFILIDKEFEILPPEKKKVGELTWLDFKT